MPFVVVDTVISSANVQANCLHFLNLSRTFALAASITASSTPLATAVLTIFNILSRSSAEAQKLARECQARNFKNCD